MTPATAWTSLAPGQLKRSDELRRLLNTLISGGFAGVFRQQSAFGRIVKSALQQAEQAPFFGLPVAYANAYFSSDLLLELAPAVIENRLADWIQAGGSRFHIDTCFLGNGDWQPLLSPLAKSSVTMEARELLKHQMDFRATGAYKRYMMRLKKGRPVARNKVVLDSPELIDGYFQRYVRLFDSIRTHGILRRGVRIEGYDERSSVPGLRHRWTELWEKEIGVAIGADGEVYRLPGGQHRTAIAQALNLQRIPVQIRLLHTDWVRQQMKVSGEPALAAIHYGIARLRAYYC